MTSNSTAARSRRYGARGSSRIDDPVEYDEPANDDADDLDEYDDDDDDFVAVAAQVAATAAHASRTSRVARSSSFASGVVGSSAPPRLRDPTEPGSERAAAADEDEDDDPWDARVSSRGPATALEVEVDSYSDERPRDARIVDAPAVFATMSGDWTITIARTASGSSPPLDSPSSSSPGTRTLRLRAPRRRWVAAGAVPGRTEAEGDARAFGSDGKARDVSAGSSTRGRLARHPIARARPARALDMGRPRER